MYKRYLYHYFVFIFMIFYMEGCGSSIPSTSSSTAAATMRFETITPVSTRTVVTPSPRYTATFQTPSATPTLRPTITSTIRPTIPLEEARATAVEMIKTFGNCKFPCWMGITPGNIRVGLDGKINAITAIQSYQTFPIWKILIDYGKPQEIKMFVMGNFNLLGDAGYVELVLFYSDQGMMVEIPVKTNQAKVVDICLNEPHIQSYSDTRSQSTWYLWNPNDPKTFEQAGTKMGLITKVDVKIHTVGESYLPLEELTDLNVDTFYERYSQQDNENICFKAQDPVWMKHP